MFRQMTNDKQTFKHKLGNRTNRWSTVQTDARCPNSKKKCLSTTQRQRPRRLKKDNLRISQEVEFIQFVYIVSEISQTEYVRRLQNHRQKKF